MSTLEIWLAILGLTLATIVSRATVLLLGDRIEFGPRVEAALRFAPACALAAIIAPDLLVSDGRLALGLDNLRALAALGAAGLFLLTRSIVWTIAGGMALYWVLRWALY